MMFVGCVCVPVVDQDRALQFYTEKLGFTLKVDAPCPGMDQRWIELVSPGSETQVVLFTSQDFDTMIGKNMNLMFTTNDIVQTHKDLLDKGVEIVSEPKKESWGIHMTLKDSEGNLFCVCQETNVTCQA